MKKFKLTILLVVGILILTCLFGWVYLKIHAEVVPDVESELMPPPGIESVE